MKKGRPLGTEKKVVISGFITESVFAKIAKIAIQKKQSLSRVVGELLIGALVKKDS